jgi:phosphomannomutase
MSSSPAELLAAAQAWIDGDPEAETQTELRALLATGDVGALRERLTPLEFGTAGLRGPVGAGSGRMNVAVVLRTAFGIARYLEQRGPSSAPIVIGFDARPTSRRFAEASAGVLLAAGFRVVAFDAPVATPLCAFLGRELGAPVTIVVTASHNPKADNGYKVYGADAVQIVSPTDREIAAQIAAAPAARLIPQLTVSFAGVLAPGLELVSAATLHAYFRALGAALPPGTAARELRIAHSALHGVGTAPMRRALAEAGFTNVASVAAQAEPDGTFPTTPFPNPEEPGTLDLALAEAERMGADLLLVNDPDADRLAAAARLDGALVVLDGNQVGALLADYALSSATSGARPLVLSSVVSSPLVAELSSARGAHYERTHTGFKWLWNAALSLVQSGALQFCFAYEEALGYSIFPAVRDKDGISAGRALAELAARQASRRATLFDRLFELYVEHGLWTSAARNISLRGPTVLARLQERLDRLAREPISLAGSRVRRVVDYRSGASERAPWLGSAALLELELEGGRVFVRPSGTEPKLKLYAHVKRSVTLRSELARELEDARRFASALLSELEGELQF